MTLRYTWFRSRLDPHGKRGALTLGELADRMASPKQMAWPAGPLDRDAATAQAKALLPLISFATFRDDRRANANAESLSALGLDLDVPTDEPTDTIERLAEALGGVTVLAHSSASSRIGAWKLRAYVPFAREVGPDAYRDAWHYADDRARAAGLEIDGACKDPSRGFFVWRRPLNLAYWSTRVDGRTLDVATLPPRRKPEPVAPPSGVRLSPDAVERARRYIAKMPAAISGSGGHTQTFVVACRLVRDFGLEEADAMALLSEYNQRCRPPWSERELLHKLQSAGGAR